LGRAHERAGADAAIPGPALTSALGCRRAALLGPKEGREEAVDRIWADEEDGEWEVELVSAVVEALAGEE